MKVPLIQENEGPCKFVQIQRVREPDRQTGRDCRSNQKHARGDVERLARGIMVELYRASFEIRERGKPMP